MECLICLYVAKNIDVQLVMGASQCGWGAWIPGKEAQGLWNERMSMKSSNYRELFAVLMGILSFKDQLKNQKILILSDNVTMVAMINGMGSYSIQLDIVARTIHIEVLEANITLSEKYLARNFKLEGRSPVPRKIYVPVASSPELIQNVGQGLGAASHRHVRFNPFNTAASLQFTILGSTNFGSRCASAEK